MPDTYLGLSTEQWRDIVRHNEMTGEQVRSRFIRYNAIEDAESYWFAQDDILPQFASATETLGTNDAATLTHTFPRSATEYLEPDYRTLVLAEPTAASYIRLGDAFGSSTVADSIGAVTGTVGTGITLGVTGLVGGDASTAAQGAPGSIDFGDNYDFAGNAPFTVEFLVNNSASAQRIIGKADGSSGWSIDIDANGFITAARRG